MNKLISKLKTMKVNKLKGDNVYLSKNQKRKLERYGIIPAALRTISDQGSSVFRQAFGDEIRTAKKRIYRKPWYRYLNKFETEEALKRERKLLREMKNQAE